MARDIDRVDEELAAVGAILVEDRLLRRLIKRHRHVPGMGLQVPHATSYALAKAELTAHLDPTELTTDLDRLPERVAVLTGRKAELARGVERAWCAAWRAIFHAHVHHALDALVAAGKLGAADVRQRINAIGQIEFDEARLVLRQEDLLLPPADDTGTYVELVALYLELRHFAPRTLAKTFPILHGVPRIDAILAQDVDAALLLAAARPARAPAAPIVDEPDAGASASRSAAKATVRRTGDRATRKAAEQARSRGNAARAAILSARAGDVERAHADLDLLVTRLARSLGGAATDGWIDALYLVADSAAAQPVLRYTAGARLLHDLQTACIAAEREVEVVDALSWARSFGKRAIVRTLPATREIRVARRVRAAAKKLPAVDLSAGDREQLAAVLEAMVERANQNVRDVLRPTLEATLVEVGLVPRHLPGRVAQRKLVDELLDRAVASGRLSLGNLRDAVAHNELKLPDLRPAQLATGDQLLRADRMLATSLAGVYRRGEIYLRFLQKVSSVLSGTGVGRLLTLYLLLPIVGSFFVVEGLQHMVAPVARWTGNAEPEIATRPAFLGVGILVFLLLHASWFRRASLYAVRLVGRGLRIAILDSLLGLWRVPLVRPITRWFVLPAMPALLAFVLLDGLGVWRWPIAGAIFLATTTVLNSSAAEELISDFLLRSGRQLSQRILPGLVKYSLELFGWLIELSERAIYKVDELLRFRPNQSPVVAVVKGVLGTMWFAIAYVLRIYVNLLIEPTVNPVKHFPVVTVAAKLILPFIPQMTVAIGDPVSAVFGPAVGTSFGAFTVLVLPGIAGFLAWEFSANWKLYRANRKAELGPTSIGSHGETIAALLKPGFHSGTVPKLYAKLRRATWKGQERAVARYSEGLHHVEDAVWKFADRQLVSMLNQDLTFHATDVAVEHVDVGSNRLRIDLVCPSVGEGVTTLAFEEQSGWLVASVPQAGWLSALEEHQRRVVEIALAGFYKLSGVDLVREQLEHVLVKGGLAAPPAYDLGDEGLVVWPGPGFDVELVYDLRATTPAPSVRGAAWAGEPPVLAGQQALFGREPIKWTAWSTAWERLALGMEPPRLVFGPSLLPSADPASLA